jgi:cellulose synthase A
VYTGRIFNRTALYGYDPPLNPKYKKSRMLSTSFGRSGKRRSRSSGKDADKKKCQASMLTQLCQLESNLEYIEGGVEGAALISIILYVT